MFDLTIKGGTIVTAEATYNADLGINDEQIAAIGNDLSGRRELDATGLLVTPGAVDIHVHLQMPIGDFVSSDDFFSGTRAAALGGTTSIVDFVEPNGQPMLEALAARRSLADPKVVVDYGLHMTIGPQEIDKLDQVQAAYEAGCVSFKLYMAYGLRLSDGQLLRSLEAIRDANGLPVVHAENWDVITTLIARNLAQGRTTPHWHPRSRPAVMEGEAVGRVIDLAAYTGARLHIFHVSSREAIERIGAARRRRLPVTAETCPQYLLLNWEVYDAPGVRGAWPVCSPPIRDLATQDRLWQALQEGDLQVVSTDHCPFSSADKAKGMNDYSKIPGGVPSIESRYAALFTCGVKRGLITANQWVDSCCTQPARIVGLKKKGRIQIGYDADLALFDPDQAVTLSTATLHENVDWTPYEGIQLSGWPRHTISRGDVIVENGTFHAAPGRGRFVHRKFD